MRLTKVQADILDSFMVALWGSTWGDNPTMIGVHQASMDEAKIPWSMQNSAAHLVQSWRGSLWTNRIKRLNIKVI